MPRRLLLYARVNPADEGGVQAVFSHLARHLRSRGHGVVKAWALPAPADAGDLTIPLPPLVMRGRLPAPRSTLWACRALARLSYALLRHRPHVVNVHYVTGEAIYFALLKPLFRYRLVLSFHGSDVLRTQPPDAPLLPRILPRADAITAVSELAAARLRGFPGVDPACVHVIPNGVDCDFWRAPGGGDLQARGPVVLSVGRLDPVKGHDVLLRGFPRVLDRVPAARLVIVGDGGYRETLERMAAGLGIAPAVQFAGPVDAAGVREWLWRSRVFVLPSRSEGLPLALLEAMAAGVPSIATAVGGSPEVVTAGTGILVPPEDAGALGDAIAALLGDGSALDALSRQGRVRAAAFSSTATNAAYETVLMGSDGGQTGVRPGSDPGHAENAPVRTAVRAGSERGQSGVRPGSEAVHSGR